MRLDKFLWCVRLHATRPLAAEECRKGRVRIGDREAKAAAEVAPGDHISVRRPPIDRQYEVLAIPPSRVGASLVAQYLVERTPQAELDRWHEAERIRREQTFHDGRPTKRQRRDMDRFRSEG